MEDILEGVMGDEVDPLERLNKIFHGYGHTSVADMANLSVFIHDIPVAYSMRLFQLLYVVGGQERSTRFQDFSKPDYFPLPDLGETREKELQQLYDEIMAWAYQNYRELLILTQAILGCYFDLPQDHPQVKRRSFDTARYMLPLGHNTSLGLVMNARHWAWLISELRGSPDIIDREIGDLLFGLLGEGDESTGYRREAGDLIRYTEPRKNAIAEAAFLVENAVKRRYRDTGEPRVSTSHPFDTLIDSLARLPYPRSTIESIEPMAVQLVAKTLFESHDHYNQIGNVGQSGAINVEIMADMGVVKDLGRHRSAERWTPFLTPHINMEKEVISSEYSLCPYLDIGDKHVKALKRMYAQRVVEHQKRVQEWMGKVQCAGNLQYAKILLPYAHTTHMRMGLSLDDFQYIASLRTRPGGHIAYRTLVHDIVKVAAENHPAWGPLLGSIPEVRVDDKEQFTDRS